MKTTNPYTLITGASMGLGKEMAIELLAAYSVDQLINNAGVGGTARFEEASAGYLDRIGLLTAGQITRQALDGAENGKEVIIPGFTNKLNRILARFTPESWRLSLMDKVLQKELALKNSN